MNKTIEIEINQTVKHKLENNDTPTHTYSESTLKSFHKIFGHIREFPHIDPSANIVINENDYISELEKNERI
jgi:hypothetical protein